MNLQNKIEKLKYILKNKLPIIEAHYEFYPLKNRNYKPLNNNYNKAAVTLIITKNHQNQDEIIFIKRPVYEGVHSGQIAFPGGKIEKNDNSLLETAIRECYEEINLNISQEHLVGELSDVFIPVSNFLVKPFLFYVPIINKESIIPSNEVDDIFLLKLTDILNQDNRSSTKVKTLQNTEITVQCFNINNKIIWGATGLMLNELKYTLKML